MHSVETVNCDNCGSSDATITYELQDDLYEIPGHFLMNTCQKCGLMYLSPRPTQESMAGFYPDRYENYKAPIEAERLPLLRWMRRRKLVKRRNLIELYSNASSGDLLDVGCATGLFMNEMAQSGWQVQGIEPIEKAANFARDHYGFIVHSQTLEDAALVSASFDVVTYWDVLEHTFSPTKELNTSARILRPGGLLAITIPNWNSVEREIFGEYWQGLDPPRHLYVFPIETLNEMLTSAGFQIVDQLCFMTSFFSFAISLERWLKSRSLILSLLVSKVLNFPGTRLLFEPLFSQINRLGRGAVVAIFAKKVM